MAKLDFTVLLDLQELQRCTEELHDKQLISGVQRKTIEDEISRKSVIEINRLNTLI